MTGVRIFSDYLLTSSDIHPGFSNPAAARHARSARPLAVGTLRPNIVLYDEAHPLGDEIGALSTRDMTRRPDLLVIMGVLVFVLLCLRHVHSCV